MKTVAKAGLLAGAILIVALAAAVIFYIRPADDGRTPEQRKQIAEACITLMRSSLTNKAELKMDDPRIPEVIRALHPLNIEMAGDDVVVACPGKPAEYHLSRSSNDSKTWVLYVAGSGYIGHREVFRMKHD